MIITFFITLGIVSGSVVALVRYGLKKELSFFPAAVIATTSAIVAFFFHLFLAIVIYEIGPDVLHGQIPMSVVMRTSFGCAVTSLFIVWSACRTTYHDKETNSNETILKPKFKNRQDYENWKSERLKKLSEKTSHVKAKPEVTIPMAIAEHEKRAITGKRALWFGGIATLIVASLITFQLFLRYQEAAVEDIGDRVNIPDVGYIDVPEIMEVKDLLANPAVKERVFKEMNIDPKSMEGAIQNLMVKQKGLEMYARLIVETIPGKPGEFERLMKKYTITKQELKAMEDEIRTGFEQQFRNTPIKILEWYPIEPQNINKMQTITFSFKRQLKDNPPVIVKYYLFQNYDRLIRLTVSYRLQEKTIWEDLLKKSVNSFHITNIK